MGILRVRKKCKNYKLFPPKNGNIRAMTIHILPLLLQ